MGEETSRKPYQAKEKEEKCGGQEAESVSWGLESVAEGKLVGDVLD